MIKDRELLHAQQLAKVGAIYAPTAFLIASLEELKRRCNGCGSSSSWFKPFKRILGTSILEACIIHDYMYSTGYTNDDKEEADRVFLNNMNRLITRDSVNWNKPTKLQRFVVRKYYLSVKYGGGESFWAGKG